MDFVFPQMSFLSLSLLLLLSSLFLSLLSSSWSFLHCCHFLVLVFIAALFAVLLYFCCGPRCCLCRCCICCCCLRCGCQNILSPSPRVHWSGGWRVAAAASPALSFARRQLDFGRAGLLPVVCRAPPGAPSPSATCIKSNTKSKCCFHQDCSIFPAGAAVRSGEGQDEELGHARGDQQLSFN